MAYKKRCSSCIHILCDVVGRNRPERNIDFVCESIVLFEKSYGLEYKEETRELALEAISKYGPGTTFENDERMLPIYRILGKYSRSMSSTDIYDKLHEKGLFSSSSMFFFDWVDVHLLAGQTEKAKDILKMMETAVGAENDKYLTLRRRIYKEKERGEEKRGLPNQGLIPQQSAVQQSKIAQLVKPADPSPHSARRSLFGKAEPIEGTSPSTRRAKPVAPPPPTQTTQSVPSQAGIPEEDVIKSPAPPPKPVHPLRDEPIVLPNIVDAPPIDMSIVSPSMNLIQSGQVPSNFSLPPVFSFSNSMESSYRPVGQTTTTSAINSSLMSTTTAASARPPLAPTASGVMQSSSTRLPPASSSLLMPPPGLEGLPSHPAQIGQTQFPMPDLSSYHNDFVLRNQKENTENQDPSGDFAGAFYPRREISGVLLPSKGILLDKYTELEKEVPEKKLLSGADLKKMRLQSQGAARKIFLDPTAQLESAFQSLGLGSPSTSNQ